MNDDVTSDAPSSSSRWRDSAYESDEESVSLPAMTLDEAKTIVRTDWNKTPLSCAIDIETWVPTVTTDCTIAWSLDSLLAQGTVAYIFDGCMPEHNCNAVVRVAALRTAEDAKHFQTDATIRLLLTCRKPDTTPILYDAFECRRDEAHGITVMEKYEGDLVDLLIRHPLLVNMQEIRNNVAALIRDIQTLRIVHNDVGWQNVLYRINNGRVRLVLTDFENGYWFYGKNDNDRMWSMTSNNDANQPDVMIEHLQLVQDFLNKYNAHDAEMRDAWRAMDAFEADKLKRVLHLSDEMLDELEGQ